MAIPEKLLLSSQQNRASRDRRVGIDADQPAIHRLSDLRGQLRTVLLSDERVPCLVPRALRLAAAILSTTPLSERIVDKQGAATCFNLRYMCS